MVEAEELRARQLLLDMQDQLSRAPFEALGLIPSATAADIRNAFLTKTKQFHPARFGRMAADIQRLANEVFLALRAVHDTIVRAKAPVPRPTGPIPTLSSRPGGTGVGAAPQQRSLSGPSMSARPSAVQPVPQRAPSLPPQVGQRPPMVARPGTGPVAQGRPPTQPTRTLDDQVTQPLPVRPGQPARSAPPVAGASPPVRPLGTVTPAGGVAQVDREVATILELIAQTQLAAAKLALETLVARKPQVARNQALLSFVKGRIAQLDRRSDEARVELQDALQLDPDLQLAKSALAELFTRRR